MLVCVVGTGYVGLVTGACLAEIGHTVICVDKDEDRVDQLQFGELPFYEPGLLAVVSKARETASGYAEPIDKQITFTSSLEDALALSPSVTFICVGTPYADNELNLSSIHEVLENFQYLLRPSKQAAVVVKSTVLPGTVASLNEAYPSGHFEIISNPEFLKEGHAVEDFRRPDRIVVGAENDCSFKIMRDLYSHFIRNGHSYLEMNPTSAELTKVASNAMLATRISFINEIAFICDKVGADVMDVRRGIGTDSRIGSKFIYPGIGFGGSCFPKDVRALSVKFQELGRSSSISTAALIANSHAVKEFSDRIAGLLQEYRGNSEKCATIWGLSFKPKTDDTREAPAKGVIARLKAHHPGIELKVYDPVVEGLDFDYDLTHCTSRYDACAGSDILILCTEWAEFRKPSWDIVQRAMRTPVVADGRNQWNPTEVKSAGFVYYCIGRPKHCS